MGNPECCPVCEHGGDCKEGEEWAWHETGSDVPTWAICLMGFGGLTAVLLAYVLVAAMPYE